MILNAYGPVRTYTKPKIQFMYGTVHMYGTVQLSQSNFPSTAVHMYGTVQLSQLTFPSTAVHMYGTVHKRMSHL